ncbi:MAG: hypothetical protein RSA92_02625, partial [Bacteroidaceae bacterium]
MQIVEKTEGKKIEYFVEEDKITFGDEELTVNVRARERDYAMAVDVCRDKDGCLTLGANENTRRYVAQIEIPPREYDIADDGCDEEGVPKSVEI